MRASAGIPESAKPRSRRTMSACASRTSAHKACKSILRLRRHDPRRSWSRLHNVPCLTQFRRTGTGWIVGQNLYPQSSPSAPVHSWSLQLTALDQLLHRLARHSEPTCGVLHRNCPQGRLVHEPQPQVLAYANLPRRPRRQMLPCNKAFVDPAVDARGRGLRLLCRLRHDDQSPRLGMQQCPMERDAPECAIHGHPIAREAQALSSAPVLAVEVGANLPIQIARWVGALGRPYLLRCGGERGSLTLEVHLTAQPAPPAQHEPHPISFPGQVGHVFL